MHVQSYGFADLNLLFFAALIAVAVIIALACYFKLPGWIK